MDMGGGTSVALTSSFLGRGSVAGLILSAVVAGAGAQAAPVAFDLPAQPLAESIHQVSKASGLAFTLDQGVLAGKLAPAIHGSLEPLDAIKQLLAGSGLALVKEEDGTLVIAQVATKKMGEVTVESTSTNIDYPRDDLQPDSFSNPYRVPTSNRSGTEVFTATDIANLKPRDVFDLLDKATGLTITYQGRKNPYFVKERGGGSFTYIPGWTPILSAKPNGAMPC